MIETLDVDGVGHHVVCREEVFLEGEESSLSTCWEPERALFSR